MKPSHALSLANQGNPRAIAQIINKRLRKKGVIAKVTRQGHSICITLEAVYAPQRKILLPLLWHTLKALDAKTVQNATIRAKRFNCQHIIWFEELPLVPSK
ncbi:MAG: hypothetical protein AAGD25_23865 [Cyanobacteria bacterium P01_F01_bin.150]